MSRRALPLAAVALAVGVSFARVAAAQSRWVDDDAVLAARRIRIDAGFGAALFLHQTFTDHTYAVAGTGLNLEEAAGIGHGLEIGVRFGLRLDDGGRGLRADEVARGFDTETFGTGLATVPNPELRIRWRGARVGLWEIGLEDRVVLPLETEPEASDVLGLWASLHLGHIARVDGAFQVIVTVQKFAIGRVAQPGLAAPLRLWINATRSLYFGVLGAAHSTFATSVTSGNTVWEAGIGAGYRLGLCDLQETTLSLDASQGLLSRTGVALGLSCRM